MAPKTPSPSSRGALDVPIGRPLGWLTGISQRSRRRRVVIAPGSESERAVGQLFRWVSLLPRVRRR
jgi:hypothetical protein